MVQPMKHNTTSTKGVPCFVPTVWESGCGGAPVRQWSSIFNVVVPCENELADVAVLHAGEDFTMSHLSPV